MWLINSSYPFLQQKCVNKWIGSAPRSTILQLSTPCTNPGPSLLLLSILETVCPNMSRTSAPSMSVFRGRLKTFLFKRAFPWLLPQLLYCLRSNSCHFSDTLIILFYFTFYSKVSRWHCFNGYAFTLTFWLCTGQRGISTKRKMSQSECAQGNKQTTERVATDRRNTVRTTKTKNHDTNYELYHHHHHHHHSSFIMLCC